MAITQNQRDKAKQFQEIHRKEGLFVLPNIWDAGGAKIFEQKRFAAVATTSAGVAFANGFSDGEELPLTILLETVQRISTKITIPLSVDFERGYSENAEEVYENAKQLLLAGAVGLNIEDGLPDKSISDRQSMKRKLEYLNQLKKEFALDFLINSRTDIYWNQIGEQKSRLSATIERLNRYLSWGADCVFVPGNISVEELQRLIKEVNGPINILLSKNLKNMNQLNELGVKRVSLGSSVSRNSIKHLFNESNKIKRNDFDSLLSDSLSYDFVNQFYGMGEEK